MIRTRVTLLSLFCTLFAPALTHADPTSEAPQLVELFTSQGCSSCPPAEKLFATLAQDPGLVTIEWHVDYWDSLVHAGSKWKDPYSSKANTERQRDYNQALRDTRGVYTPQAVFAGSAEFIGSHADKLAAARKAAPATQTRLVVTNDTAKLSGNGAGTLTFVRLLKEHETHVKGGENKGRQLSGRNIALEKISLGEWTGGDARFDIPAVKPGETCVLFVQSPRMGPVLAASYCDN